MKKRSSPPPPPAPPVRAQRVPLRVRLGSASQVHVAGDFNGWSPEKTALAKAPDGTWSADLDLAPGTYQYRLLIDGGWADDPGAERRVPNPFGSQNCLLVVAGQASAVSR